MRRWWLLLAAAGCDGGGSDPEADTDGPPWPYELPTGFPAPPVPAANPITDAKVELGRYLFHDPQLSGNGTQACASCHDQARAFTDGRALPVGSTGDTIPRNAMTLTNAAYWSTYTWMNPTLETLEDQALVPMFADHPIELGMTTLEGDVLARFAGDPGYAARFADAFEDGEVTTAHVVDAIASFERTLISGASPYDRYWYGGDEGAMSDDALAGQDLFFSEATECYHCHAGPMLTTAFVTADQPGASPSFANTGLYDVDGQGSYPAPNVGLYEFTRDSGDMGRFRVPTLRNVAVTGPWFHDGSAATLEEVIRHYEAGGRTIADGPNAGVGADNPHKDPLVKPIDLTDAERAQLIAFLEALTDEAFLSDPRFASPF